MSPPVADSEPSFSLTWLWATCLAVCLSIFVVDLMGRLSYQTVQDDSFMFYRYAYRLATEHRLSWNPHGETTHGLTALGYLAAVMPLYALFAPRPAVTMVSASIVCGIGWLALQAFGIWRHCSVRPGFGRAAILFLGILLVASSPSLAGHFVGGMDTTFSMAFATSLILLAYRFECGASTTLSIIWGIWGGLAFLARPDLAVFSCILPASLSWLGSERRTRCLAALSFGITAFLILIEMGLCAWLLHSPVPLPFFAKATRHYPDFDYETYALSARYYGIDFLRFYGLPIFLFGACLLTDPRDWWKRSSALDKGLLASAVLFVGYYHFFVLQIMGGNQRFYLPALPALIFLACRSALLVVPVGQPFRGRAIFSSRLVALVLIFGCLAGIPSLLMRARQLRSSLVEKSFANLEVGAFTHFWRGIWVGLEPVSKLPKDLVIAATEVGFLGAMNLDKSIIDMAGLHSRAFAHEVFSARRFFSQSPPDLLYMPHPDYRGMIREIEGSPVFRDEYEYFPAERLHALSGVALRRSSRHYPSLHRIFSAPPP